MTATSTWKFEFKIFIKRISTGGKKIYNYFIWDIMESFQNSQKKVKKKIQQETISENL